MLDKEKLAYDLALAYASQILSEHREENDTIDEMNDLLLGSFKQGYDYQCEQLGIKQ
jgi:hypothetical protein